MLVVANGPFKSGSTWLYQIARELIDASDLPHELRRPEWGSVDSPRDDAWPEVVELGRSVSLVVKTHDPPPQVARRIGRNSDHVALVCISRDPVAVVRSARDHFAALGFGPVPLDRFYEEHGRFIVDAVRRHVTYYESGRVPGLLLSYEQLVKSFDSEIQRLARYLGRDADSAPDQAAVSIGALRRQYADDGMAGMAAEAFFRDPSGREEVPLELATRIRDDAGRPVSQLGRLGASLRQYIRRWWHTRLRVTAEHPSTDRL